MSEQKTSLGRRHFLAVGSALTGAALLDFPSLIHARDLAPSGHGDPLSSSAWVRLGRQLQGRLLRPGQAGFSNLALPNNLRYRNIRPGGIALCANAADIATCLRWAKRHDIPLITRGGGHSYAGYSCTEGLMINLMSISDVRFNTAERTVTIGGGTLNGSIYSTLQAVDRSITHGRCPTVGAGGFLLGGGIGFDMRRNGIASDKVIRTELVLADGEIVTASANQNPDIFWACRGGAGGNFGINTSFTLETFPVDRSVEFQINWANVSDEFLASLFLHFENAPEALGSKITLSPGLPLPGQPAPINVGAIGQFIGTVDQLVQILAPIKAIAAPNNSVVQEVAYWSGSTYLADAGKQAYFQERSRFINGPMTPAIITAIRDWLPRWPNAQGSGSIKFFQTGGATQALSPTETAFVHRQSQWLASIEIDWTPGQTPIHPS